MSAKLALVVSLCALAPLACGGGGGNPSGDPNGVVSEGSYECYTYSDGELMPAPGENFRITGPGAYEDVDSAAGGYVFDEASSVVTFQGAALDGERAKFDATASPKTITFLDAQGNLGDSCDLTN